MHISIQINDKHMVTAYSIGASFQDGIDLEVDSSFDTEKIPYCYYRNGNLVYDKKLECEIRKEDKNSYIDIWLKDKIENSFEADVLGRGNLEYSLDDEHRNDMNMLMNMINMGQQDVLWMDNSRAAGEKYTADQFSKLYKLSVKHIEECNLKAKRLKAFLNTLEEPDEIESLEWDTDIPFDDEGI